MLTVESPGVKGSVDGRAKELLSYPESGRSLRSGFEGVIFRSEMSKPDSR